MRTLSSNNQTNTLKTVTEPVYLVSMGFATPIRLSSRETLMFDGNEYVAASLEVRLSDANRSLRFFDANYDYSPTFASEGSEGTSVTVYKVYGRPPFTAADADIFHEGVLGAANIADWIDVNLLSNEPSFSPRIRATTDIFSFLPPHGTEIVTRAGTFVIERQRT